MIASRGMKIDSRRQICGLEGDFINHLLFTFTLARQVWALSRYPNPLNGFNGELVYGNINGMLANVNNMDIPLEIRRSFPWIMWYICKNINSFCFEGNSLVPTDSVEKILEESSGWFQAQNQERASQGTDLSTEVRIHIKWKLPPDPWLK